jgi:ribonuclease HII
VSTPTAQPSSRSGSQRSSRTRPTLAVERMLPGVVCGVDEVGKGSWAGPLVVCVAVLSSGVREDEFVARDSKSISEKKREQIFDTVASQCAGWALGHASHAECDALGMNEAQLLATRRAFDALRESGVRPDSAIVDGRWDFVSPCVAHVVTRVKADADSLSVAAASVLAKVSRDREMRDVSQIHPHWAFDTNKGYPCPKHRAGLREHGVSALHRTSWAFMENLGLRA